MMPSRKPIPMVPSNKLGVYQANGGFSWLTRTGHRDMTPAEGSIRPAGTVVGRARSGWRGAGICCRGVREILDKFDLLHAAHAENGRFRGSRGALGGQRWIKWS
jgi:hypothetical protein